LSRATSPFLLDPSRDEGQPIYLQLYRTLRSAILDGTLAAGSRLPSTRVVATESGIARKTAEEAYAALEREGFVVRRHGSGSFVASVSPTSPKARLRGERRISRRARATAGSAACVEPQVVRPFAAGLPALDQFPLELWRRTVARCARRFDVGSMVYGDPAGLPALREAVASYLASSRGVRCDASRVVIVSSAQQGLDLAARLLIDPGDEVWCEDPSYYGTRAALTAAGASIVPVGVDEEGIDVTAAIRLAPRARAAFVTPSNHYPLGMTLSLSRRLALLEWARRHDSWIVEDDYDGEFRYDGRPLAAIQSIDTDSRVIYIGTFTKTLFPSLRLAYLVVPPDLVESFVNIRTQIDGHPNTFMQTVVAEFLTSGQFVSHIRRMRTLYHARRDLLVDSLRRNLGGRVELSLCDAGLRLTVFTSGSDRLLARRASERGLDVLPLSRLYAGSAKRNGLVLGYAGLTPEQITFGVEQLRKVLA
jgi:GntR family transcriptional regulator/MocR family aminotransferase